jgi:cell division septation protein DedD
MTSVNGKSSRRNKTDYSVRVVVLQKKRNGEREIYNAGRVNGIGLPLTSEMHQYSSLGELRRRDLRMPPAEGVGNSRSESAAGSSGVIARIIAGGKHLFQEWEKYSLLERQLMIRAGEQASQPQTSQPQASQPQASQPQQRSAEPKKEKKGKSKERGEAKPSALRQLIAKGVDLVIENWEK